MPGLWLPKLPACGPIPLLWWPEFHFAIRAHAKAEILSGRVDRTWPADRAGDSIAGRRHRAGIGAVFQFRWAAAAAAAIAQRRRMVRRRPVRAVPAAGATA